VSERDVAGLLFTAEMYGVQLDQLAVRLAVSEVRARALAARWREQGYAESARLGPGRPWVWLTRDGLLACGLPYRPSPPALARLAHLRAVTAVRMALESAPGYLAARAYWRSERRLRARMGSRVPLREHLPDGEVHWPDPDGPDPGGPDPVGPDLAGSVPAGGSGGAPPWAGECWAIEAELTRKTVRRTAAIMAEILTRTGDYGCPAAEVRVPGAPARHARVLYLCSAAARPTVIRARDALPGPLAARVEIRGLPAAAGLTAGPSPAARPGSSRSGGPSPARTSAARSSPASTPPRDSTSPATPSRDSSSPTPSRDGPSPANGPRDGPSPATSRGRASHATPPRDSEAAT
jgi:hypothetical protein